MHSCGYEVEDFNYLSPDHGGLVVPTSEDRFWYGHSLPPDLERRTYDARYLLWRDGDMDDLVAAVAGQDRPVARTHRLLNDAVDFAAVFGGEMRETDFKRELLDYLAD